ncbi:hypothetical protein D7X88_05530 [bacterium C-53]|nr:hypothetical protein [Lachnospiraceae bacterium]NBI02682.1 hypothetical protein [Lachnospiraceae bacterium]RKJ11320.1 hypothetical protein D7X88_05530 [bacterium C-53]
MEEKILTEHPESVAEKPPKKKVRLHQLDQPFLLKFIVYITVSICIILFVLLLCVSVYKNNFTAESIFATLLAFFSIFISIFFYFKADETSSRFYESSYQFMKDVSVTLGKIEERFGEKLNSLNDKISHLDRISSEASNEIKDKTDDKENIIDELMDKAKLSDEERRKYKSDLAKKDIEIEQLKFNKFEAEHEAARLRGIISEAQDEAGLFQSFDEKMLEYLLHIDDISDLSSRTQIQLNDMGLIKQSGEVDRREVKRMLDKLSRH